MIDYTANLKVTGFCWKCGRQTQGLFCLKPKKCKEIYIREHDAEIRRGKKAGYGLVGSTR